MIIVDVVGGLGGLLVVERFGERAKKELERLSKWFGERGRKGFFFL